MKRYKWNKRKCAENLLTLAVMAGAGLLICWVFYGWMMA